MSSTKSTRFLLRLILLLLAVSCRFVDCDCRAGTELEVRDCVTDDGLKLLCVCKQLKNSSTSICKQSIQSFLECHQKKKESSVIRIGKVQFIRPISNRFPYANDYTEAPILISDPTTRAFELISDLCKCLDQPTYPSDGHRALNSFSKEIAHDAVRTRSTTVDPERKLSSYLLKTAFDYPTIKPIQFTNFDEKFEENKKKTSEAYERLKSLLEEQKERSKGMEKEWNRPRLNNSMIGDLSKIIDSELFILLGFLASLLMVLLVWGLLYCCHKRSRASATSELFASSTPINAYSPINSTMPSNISPISMHGDQARAALLDGSLYNMDVVPSYDDIKPPSYDDAVRNPS